MTDEYFQGFLEDFGPAYDRRNVPESSIEAYRGRLPDQLLTYRREHGWCGYADGLFWTVDPKEYEPALEAWIGDTRFMEIDAYHLIACSAFGDLYFFGEKTGTSLQIVAPDAQAIYQSKPVRDLNQRVRSFFGARSRDGCDFTDAGGSLLFAPALKKMGRLHHGLMYGFVPALALGGPATLEHLKTVKAVEHLVLLAGLSELRVMNALQI